MSSVPFLPPLRPASYIPPLPAPITSSLRRPSSFCFRPDARGRCGGARPRDGFGAPPRRMPSAPCTAAVGSGSVRWKYPRPQTCGVSCDAHLLSPKARPPALRSHAHTCDAAHAVVNHRLRSACGSLLPAPGSSTPHKVRRVVWRTSKTHSAPCSWRASGTIATVRPRGTRMSSSVHTRLAVPAHPAATAAARAHQHGSAACAATCTLFFAAGLWWMPTLVVKACPSCHLRCAATPPSLSSSHLRLPAPQRAPFDARVRPKSQRHLI